MKILIDTNILLDLIAMREPFYDNAKTIIDLCQKKKINGSIAAHSVLNIFYILKKAFTVDERRKYLKNLCLFLDVVGIDKAMILSSLDNADFSDFEDCIQAECAVEFSADYIVTRNTKDFKQSKVPAITPDDFLEKLRANGYEI